MTTHPKQFKFPTLVTTVTREQIVGWLNVWLGKLGQVLSAHTHDAADVDSGTLDTARLGSGTANNTRFLRGDRTWAALLLGPLGIGSSAATSSFNTQGLRVCQGAADDEAVGLASSDVSHGFTTVADDDTYCSIGKASATLGGAAIRGSAESNTGANVYILGHASGFPTSKDSTSRAAVTVGGYTKSGTTIATPASNSNMFAVEAGGTVCLIVDKEGDSWQSGRTTNVSHESTYQANGNSGASKTINWAQGQFQQLTLDANCTLTFTNVPTGVAFWLLLAQDTTGSRTVTWPGAVVWSGGVAPTLTTTASKSDLVMFVSNGTNHYGALPSVQLNY